MSRYTILLLVITGIFTYNTAEASNLWALGNWKLFDLEDVNIGYEKFINEGRDPVLYPETHAERIDTNINTTVAEYFFWHNNVWGTTTNSQFRAIGYEFRFGLRATSFLDIAYHHHSQHLLDRPSSTMPGFPVYDGVEFRINLFSKEKHNTLLP